MQHRTKVAETEKFELARQLEKDGLIDRAIKGYLGIIKKNPLHIDATSRLLILYRKAKATITEQLLLKDAISNHETHIRKEQSEWLETHKKVAEDSRPLAKILGLINSNELPFYEHEVLHKWKNRLEILEKRMVKNKLSPKGKKQSRPPATAKVK